MSFENELSGGAIITAIVAPLVSVTQALKKKATVVTHHGGAGAPQPQEGLTVSTLISVIASLAIVGLATYLCWQCNAGQDQVLRVLYTVLAAIFNTFYLIYYFIFHVIMEKACGVLP